MKKIVLAFSVLAVSAMVIVSCKKKSKPLVTEVTSTKVDVEMPADALFSLFSFTDVEMIGSFMADNALPLKYYMPAANSVGTVNPVQDTSASVLGLAFNQTTCSDGNLRDGTVIIDRYIFNDKRYNQYANANSRYYRSVGYAERLTLSDYKVNNWKISTVSDDKEEDGQPVYVVNNMVTDNWNPASTNLSWTIKGSFKMKKGNDSIFCRMNLLKTLINTSDTAVFAAGKKGPVNWNLATVSYSGKLTGVGKDGKPFSYEIMVDKPVTRKFPI